MLTLRLPAWFPLQSGTALLLGGLHALSFIDDSAWPLQAVALAALLALNHAYGRGNPPWAAARHGFAFGLGWFLSGVSWVYVSLTVYGGMVAPLAALGTLLLCAWLALFPAAACGMHAWLLQRWRLAPGPSLLLLFPALWMFSEWARGILLTGFPWLASGYAHGGAPLAGYAPILGVYGVSAAAALVAGALTLLAERHNRRLALTGLVTLVVVLLAGWGMRQIEWSEASGKPVQVRLLQGNIAQDTKFIPDRFWNTLDTYEKLITRRAADLIVLPETALPRFLATIPPERLERLAEFSRSSGSAIAFGVPIAESEGVQRGRYTNSVVAMRPDSPELQRYDKSHLVPFGEFVPTGFAWFVERMHMPLGDFGRGAPDQAPMHLAGATVAFNICYEDLFGAAIARQARHAQILANVSNVAWFGDSLALPQHLQIARMRAIETARPMIRATNTGMTAAIDARGRVIATLAPFTSDSLDVTVQGTVGFTPYVRWGDTAILLIGALLMAGLWATRWGKARLPLK